MEVIAIRNGTVWIHPITFFECICDLARSGIPPTRSNSDLIVAMMLCAWLMEKGNVSQEGSALLNRVGARLGAMLVPANLN